MRLHLEQTPEVRVNESLLSEDFSQLTLIPQDRQTQITEQHNIIDILDTQNDVTVTTYRLDEQESIQDYDYEIYGECNNSDEKEVLDKSFVESDLALKELDDWIDQHLLTKQK